MKIQLLTETTNAEPFLADDDFCAQEKIDGIRGILISDARGVSAMSRQSKPLKVTAGVLSAAACISGDFILDGELIGERFIAFDLQRLAGRDLCALPMHERFDLLAELPFPVVRCAVGEGAKRALLASIRAESGEGVVFKKMDEPYRDGRDANAVKFKFWNSESFAVRSVNIASGTVVLGREGKECGKCSFPFSGLWPKVGDVVEIRFQSRGKTGKCIHPVMLGVRTMPGDGKAVNVGACGSR